jgi:hypothetical protein
MIPLLKTNPLGFTLLTGSAGTTPMSLRNQGPEGVTRWTLRAISTSQAKKVAVA